MEGASAKPFHTLWSIGMGHFHHHRDDLWGHIRDRDAALAERIRSG